MLAWAGVVPRVRRPQPVAAESDVLPRGITLRIEVRIASDRSIARSTVPRGLPIPYVSGLIVSPRDIGNKRHDYQGRNVSSTHFPLLTRGRAGGTNDVKKRRN